MVRKKTHEQAAISSKTASLAASATQKQRTKQTCVTDAGEVKATAKQIVGGSSWTGKIPTTLLQEYCQKQGWARCDYVVTKSGQQFAVRHVLISKKNPKNNELTNVLLRPTVETAAILPTKATPLEARNVSAIFALHRVASDRSWLMQLPPEYRDIWKALVECKAADDKSNKSWMYASDPFKAAKEHEFQKQQWAKEAEKKDEAIRKAGFLPARQSFDWQHAAVVDMSREYRQRIETMVRGTQLVLSQKIELEPAQTQAISSSLAEYGFRKSHTLEALEHCSSQGDALEWLLLHVPEDDLPPRFLPPSYSVGISASQHDSDSLRIDYAARRLAYAGYPIDSAKACMVQYNSELLAAEVLQAELLEFPFDAPATLVEEQPEWAIEIEGIAATFIDTFRSDEAAGQCSVQIPGHKMYQLHLRPPVSGVYPDSLPTFYVAYQSSSMPAYVRLAIVRQLGQYASTLKGEPMIFSLVDWLESNLERILQNPGKLQSLSSITTGSSSTSSTRKHPRPVPRNTKLIQWDSSSAESASLRAQRDAWFEDRIHQRKMKNRESLPAWRSRAEILDALKSHAALIISGETGSGKSTQVVQFVLDELITAGHGDVASIVCTQPRRISAIGLADRVADERSCLVGTEVGYQIRGESKMSAKTKIAFVTTGVLLRKLSTQGDAGLSQVTHVFVDEVHERSVDSDFLLILLKDLMKRRKDLKVILMSATVDANFFAEYLGAKQLVIEGRTFPVTDFYVEDMVFLSSDSSPREKSKNGVNFDMIVDIVRHIDKVSGSDLSGILVFLPGVLEISRCMQAIKGAGLARVLCLPLHASLDGTEQRKVFLHTAGMRKVVLATNIAETSITIDDIGSVIDTGRVKQMAFDSEANAYKFEEVWCSKAACRQRRGRAGRVKAGVCYKIFSRSLESAKMLESTPPEILRVPLEQVSLSVLAMNKPVRVFLGQAITPPPLASLEASMNTLREIGAIESGEKDVLTPLGRHLSLIAADVRCAKLLVLSTIFGCVDEALTIASALSSKPVFSSKPEARDSRLAFGSADGDVISILNAYNAWKRHDNGRQRRLWCDENYVSDMAMQEVASTRTQLWACLREAGLIQRESHHRKDSTVATAVLRSLIGASLSPNIARIAMPNTKYAQHQSGSIAKDHVSREIKYFTNDGRVFLHPTSVLFSEIEYKQSAFLAFHQQVETSKKFIKQNTPVSTYSQLLLGHSLQLDGQGRGLIVNDWVKLRAFPKIGVLCKLLRIMLDDILLNKFEFPQETASPAVLSLITDLLASNGINM
ncbi:P-loop containing nucleoside triphosphate hydrolase protein [Protomyces lactucae-debilis]|uniref:RNA helicase n=1 Tax=Protomyces lactucae-debilis TaxID=2754530 RepID=A0A1Y2F440_PROLT|nr:P-loop containing nucleoside triphosphate hydrolase protein [Protomyces lactucae-debilis]ORY78254.1 P-loop containing nucleoside triphosphate hydrolase protein [Protomyces lactucae-debilis]